MFKKMMWLPAMLLALVVLPPLAGAQETFNFGDMVTIQVGTHIYSEYPQSPNVTISVEVVDGQVVSCGEFEDGIYCYIEVNPESNWPEGWVESTSLQYSSEEAQTDQSSPDVSYIQPGFFGAGCAWREFNDVTTITPALGSWTHLAYSENSEPTYRSNENLSITNAPAGTILMVNGVIPEGLISTFDPDLHTKQVIMVLDQGQHTIDLEQLGLAYVHNYDLFVGCISMNEVISYAETHQGLPGPEEIIR